MKTQYYAAASLDGFIAAPLLPRAITTPPLRLVSATTYGAAFVELRHETPRRHGDDGG